MPLRCRAPIRISRRCGTGRLRDGAGAADRQRTARHAGAVDLAPAHPTDVTLYWHAWTVQSPTMASLSERVVDAARRARAAAVQHRHRHRACGYLKARIPAAPPIFFHRPRERAARPITPVRPRPFPQGERHVSPLHRLPRVSQRDELLGRDFCRLRTTNCWKPPCSMRSRLISTPTAPNCARN